MVSDLNYKLKNYKPNPKKRIRKPKPIASNKTAISTEIDPEDIELEPKISPLEIAARLFIASTIVAVSIFTAFFPPTAPFAIFIIPIGLGLASAITKKPVQRYMQENPTGFLTKAFNRIIGARTKVRSISYKLTKDEHAIEGLAIIGASAATQHKGIKTSLSGISASRIAHGEGSTFEKEATLKHLHKTSAYNNKFVKNNPTAQKVEDTIFKTAMNNTTKKTTTKKTTATDNKKEQQTTANEVKKSLSKHTVTESTSKHNNAQDVSLKKAKQTLAKHGAQHHHINKKQLNQINKLSTPIAPRETAAGLNISTK